MRIVWHRGRALVLALLLGPAFVTGCQESQPEVSVPKDVKDKIGAGPGENKGAKGKQPKSIKDISRSTDPAGETKK